MAEKKASSNGDKRTKKQLLEELDSLQEELRNTKQELKDCYQRAEVVEGQEQQVETLKAQIEKLQQKTTSLEKVLAEKESRIKTLMQEKSEAIELSALLETEVNEKTTEMEALREQLQRLEAGEPTQSDVKAAKSTFRIELYPREGSFQGRIIHSLTGDRKTFQGPGFQVVENFINAHLPAEQPQPAASSAESVKLENNGNGHVDSQEYYLFTCLGDEEILTSVIEQYEDFKIVMTFPEDVFQDSEGEDVVLNAEVFATSIQCPESYSLGKISKVLRNTEFASLALEIPAGVLEPGFYRLESRITCQTPEGIISLVQSGKSKSRILIEKERFN
ncbi:MAG: hypothetical protein D6748_09830 [Calditrichaeota bacterium]|nr:MAG: hypothetical protein D6748_09830 [Calditrichota bacterium]